MIGISRESVSRLFIEFKKRKLAELDGSTLHIRDRELLQLIADGKVLILMGRRPNGAGESHPSSAPRMSDSRSDNHFYPYGV